MNNRNTIDFSKLYNTLIKEDKILERVLMLDKYTHFKEISLTEKGIKHNTTYLSLNSEHKLILGINQTTSSMLVVGEEKKTNLLHCKPHMMISTFLTKPILFGSSKFFFHKYNDYLLMDTWAFAQKGGVNRVVLLFSFFYIVTNQG